MDTRRLQIALLFIISFLSNITAIAIELFGMTGELYLAAVANPLSPTLKAEFTEITKGLNDPTLPWMLTIILTLSRKRSPAWLFTTLFELNKNYYHLLLNNCTLKIHKLFLNKYDPDSYSIRFM
ncbi:MAG: hypothetical protein ACRC1Z_05880 [Waterburya sp.]